MLIAIMMIAVFCGAMLIAATSDLLSMTIRNRVSITLVMAFIILAPLSGMEWRTYGLHIVAGLLVLSITFGLFILRAMGGGDAKLLAATALWLGFDQVLPVYVITASIFGGVLTLLILAYRALPAPAVADRLHFMRHLARKDVGIPYGIALGTAGLWIFPQSATGLWALQTLGLIF